MSYPQFQAASDYLGAIADEDYVKALPSNSYEDRGGAVLDGPEAGYKVTYTQADAEAVTAEDGRVILMDEHLADSDAMDYDTDREICLNMEELSGREPDKDSYEFTELWSGEVLHCGKEALTVVVPAHGTKVFSVIISIPQLVLSRSSFALSMRMDVM